MTAFTKFIRHDKFAGTDQARFTTVHHYWLAALRQGMTLDTVWDYFVFPTKADMYGSKNPLQDAPWLDDIALSLTFSDYPTARWAYLTRGIATVDDPAVVVFNDNQWGQAYLSFTKDSDESSAKAWFRQIFDVLVDPSINLSDDRARNSPEEYLRSALTCLNTLLGKIRYSEMYDSLLTEDFSFAETICSRWFNQKLVNTFHYPEITSLLQDHRPKPTLSNIVDRVEACFAALEKDDAFLWEPYEALVFLQSMKPAPPLSASMAKRITTLFFEDNGDVSLAGAKMLTAIETGEGKLAFKNWPLFGLKYATPEIEKMVSMFRTYSTHGTLPYGNTSSEAFDWFFKTQSLSWSEAFSWIPDIVDRYVHTDGFEWGKVFEMAPYIEKNKVGTRYLTRGLDHSSLKTRAFYAIACIQLRHSGISVLSKEGTNLDISKDANFRKVITQYLPEWKPMVRMYDQLFKSGLLQDKMDVYFKQQMGIDPAAFGLVDSATHVPTRLPEDLLL